jgi:transposase
VRAHATAVACSLPRQHAQPITRWSAAELARQVCDSLEACTISPSTVRRWLHAECIRPWRYHAWQHIHDPQTFLERARPVLDLYARAQALLNEGTWVVCVDEKTSIQAREGEEAPRAAQAGKPVLVAARYRRRGARHLFAALSVADGTVYGQCHPRKRFVDFQALLREVVLPEAKRRGMRRLVLILDNGTTHAPKQLEGWVQAEAVRQGLRLAIQICWLPKNASWLDQVEIWFSRLQRKLLQPNHFASVAELEQAIQEFIACSNRTARPIKWTYTVEKLEQKLGIHL